LRSLSSQSATATEAGHAASHEANGGVAMFNHHDHDKTQSVESSQVAMTAAGVASMLGVIGMIGVVALKRERMSSASRESLLPFSKVSTAPNYGALATADPSIDTRGLIV
jgi:hypothetical protein